ncbi:uncharacterized protein IWZ02DRAFT_443432 [Phyllosticta citriasiana]|uniref:uncharacterized protein n=1 Tax=Phyllosticta citriasiana TaxID=595635 RepID=UPI0030FDD469
MRQKLHVFTPFALLFFCLGAPILIERFPKLLKFLVVPQCLCEGIWFPAAAANWHAIQSRLEWWRLSFLFKLWKILF